MPTQPPSPRPFFASFLSAFRSRTIPSAQASSMTVSKSQTQPSSTTSTSQNVSNPTVATSQPLPIAKSSGPTSSALSQLHSPPLSRSPGPSPGERLGHMSSPTPGHQHHAGRTKRRGSDSSSEGVNWREAVGEKWYIGGQTATGEERYFRMGVVRRDRSLERDRGSVDGMSL